jgi:hypothetical protein
MTEIKRAGQQGVHKTTEDINRLLCSQRQGIQQPIIRLLPQLETPVRISDQEPKQATRIRT